MNRIISITVLVAGITMASEGLATGLATCDSGPEDNWQSREKLEQTLVNQGWNVRRIKVDGGCYEVYALDDKGQRVEAYFHPLTLDPVATEKD